MANNTTTRPPLRFLLVILNCDQYNNNYEQQRRHLLETVLPKLPKDVSWPIVYVRGNAPGAMTSWDPTTSVLRVPTPDTYEAIGIKLWTAYSYLLGTQEFDFLIKMDDNVLCKGPEFILNDIRKYASSDYMGAEVASISGESDYHFGKCHDAKWNKTKVKLEPCTYAGGPFYVLSRKAVTVLVENHRNDFAQTVYEDYTVGHCLAKHGIAPLHTQWKDKGYVVWSKHAFFSTKMENTKDENLTSKIDNFVVTSHQIGRNGRLGNQVFQMWAVLSLAKQANARCCFPLDVTKLPLATLFDLSELEFADMIPTVTFKERGPTVKEVLPSYKKTDVVALAGYFQHLGYLRLMKPLPLQGRFNAIASQYRNHIGIHVRRGDYVDLPHIYTKVPTSYYLAGLDRITLKKSGSTRVVVCSDDIEWCKKNLVFSAGFHVQFSSGESELVDFAILAGCKSLVMSNSSFSCAAAQYNKENVVCPWPWFTHNGPLAQWNNKAALTQANWTILPV